MRQDGGLALVDLRLVPPFTDFHMVLVVLLCCYSDCYYHI